jgi:hypothetical protein
MPSDVFWTGLYTFAGGVVGGTTGYITARLQNHVQRAQLALEMDRHRSEERRLAREREDDERERRRLLYLRYLEVFETITNLPGGAQPTQDRLVELWHDFIRADNELELAGSEAIRDASYPANSVIQDAVDEFGAIVEAPDRDWDEASEYGEAHGAALMEVRVEMVGLMRADLQDTDG